MSTQISSHYDHFFARYNPTDLINKGAYGKVYKAYDRLNRRFVAIKKYNISEGLHPSTIREMFVLQELQHPNILRLVDTTLAGSRAFLVTEYMQMDLANFINIAGPITGNLLSGLVGQLLRGVAYCHSRNFMHRDLKPANILISNGVVKIADFGLARLMVPASELHLTNEVSTLWYRAPELLLGARWYNSQIDMWSLGCIIAEMSTTQPLFPGEREIEVLHKIFMLLGTPSVEDIPELSGMSAWRDNFPQWPALDPKCMQLRGVSDNVVTTILKLLELEPRKRMTADDALQEPWIRDYDPARADESRDIPSESGLQTLDYISESDLSCTGVGQSASADPIVNSSSGCSDDNHAPAITTMEECTMDTSPPIDENVSVSESDASCTGVGQSASADPVVNSSGGCSDDNRAPAITIMEECTMDTSPPTDEKVSATTTTSGRRRKRSLTESTATSTDNAENNNSDVVVSGRPRRLSSQNALAELGAVRPGRQSQQRNTKGVVM